jgi:hypothetical protein
MSAIRAGDFSIGAQITSMRASRPAKIWWVPLHDPSRGANGLLVRAARIDSAATAADTLRFTKLDYGWTLDRRPEAFFPSSFTLPTPGTWLAVATSGTDWGCLIMSVAS